MPAPSPFRFYRRNLRRYHREDGRRPVSLDALRVDIVARLSTGERIYLDYFGLAALSDAMDTWSWSIERALDSLTAAGKCCLGRHGGRPVLALATAAPEGRSA